MLITLKSITIQVGGRQLFEDISWTIEKNQNWAILGPTGSGKSILAKAISRKIPVASGEIQYFFDAHHPDQGRSYLHPNEILTLSAETHRDFLKKYAQYHQARWQSMEGEDAPTVADLLAPGIPDPQLSPQVISQNLIHLLKLDALQNRKILHLSHGESRKVQIAYLLLRSPRLLILDDPLVGLDQDSRRILTQSIETLIGNKAAQILWISSKAEEIPPGIRKILWVADHRVFSQHQPHPASEPAALESSLPAFNIRLEQYGRVLEENPVLSLPELIRLENVSVRYGEIKILNQVHWVVRPGERWALLGPNGAGKTTLLSLILADHPQSYTNSITLFGKKRGSGESIWDIKKNIGWVSPELHIYYPKTVTCLDVICSGFFDSVGLYRRCSLDQIALAAGWLAALGLEEWKAQPFQTLSTGQQRLALLARALVKNPPLLILDEPCQGLDDFAKRFFIEHLDQLCAHTRISLIYVTHYRDEIPRSIQHQLWLDHGEVRREGSLLHDI